ncbi:MAG TPA: hypothetical protein VGT24_01520 [Candidatus Acidoferrales bacterium]|nr:hypothetical protein [Candidatus Acidoferrales bacterium]
MDEIIKTLGNAVKTIGTTAQEKPLQTILTGAGGLESLLAEKKKSDILNQYLDLANNPAKSEAKIASLVQPLNGSLEKSVENSVQGYLGSRGLSESPQISEAVLSQSLAPYEQQNIQNAIDEYYRSLGLGLNAEQKNMPFEPDLSKLLASLQSPPNPSSIGALPTSTTNPDVWSEIFSLGDAGSSGSDFSSVGPL